MDTNKKIHAELLKSLRRFSENYIPIKPHKSNKNSYSNNHKEHSHGKSDSNIFSSDLIKVKNISSNDINIKHHYNKNSPIANNFQRENQIYKNDLDKSQDKQIKINLVSQKFKIANDFNEKNSNKFLNEKDECLREIFLTDKIEEDESFHFFIKNEKGNIYELSPIRKNKNNDNLYSKLFKRKIMEVDNKGFFLESNEDLK